MGRKRASGAEPLPQAVRRNNAKNERKTMEAMAENLWTSVESGKERRLRLAAERLYGLSAAPERTATQQKAAKTPAKPDAEADKAPTQRKEAETSAKPDKKTDKVGAQQKAAEIPAKPDGKDDEAQDQKKAGEAPKTTETDVDMVSAQKTTAETDTTPDKDADKHTIQQTAAELLTTSITEPDSIPTQQKAEEASTTPDKEIDAVHIRQQASKAQAVTEAVEEAALPDEVTLAEAAVPTEGAEVPEQNEEICMSSWELVDAPTPNDGAVETEPFEAGEPLITQEPVEKRASSRQEVKELSKEENFEGKEECTNVNELQGANIPMINAPVSNQQNAESPPITDQQVDTSAPFKEVSDVAFGEVDKSLSMSENADKAPVAETADNGVSGKEADLPTASQSEEMTATGTSTAALPSAEEAVMVGVEQHDVEETDSKNDCKKKKKKKKGRHAGEPSTPPTTATAGLENEADPDFEQGQQAKTGKKHKRHKDKRKQSQCESEKEAVVENKGGGQAPVTPDVVSEASACPPIGSQIMQTDENGEDTNTSEVTTTEPVVDEAWTTVETKKTKRRRKRSERKSESEGKHQIDDDNSENVTEVKTGPVLAAEEPSAMEVVQSAEESTSNGKLADETPKITSRTLGDFDRLVSSIGDLKEKIRQASEARVENSASPERIENQDIETEQKTAGPLLIESQASSDTSEAKVRYSGDVSGNSQNRCFASHEEEEKQAITTEKVAEAQDPSLPEEKVTKAAEATPDVFDLLMSGGAGLEAGFNEAFSPEEQATEEPKKTESDSPQPTSQPTETKPATALQEPESALKTKEALETDAAPDALDLLMSVDDDLEAGFKDAFGEEDRSEDMSEDKETEAQVQVTTDSNRLVEATNDGPSSVEPLEASGVKLDSAKKEYVTQDAFDLLMSAGDDLEEGFKYSFGSEKIPKEPEEQLTSESAEAKLASEPVEDASSPGPENAPKSAEKLFKETDAAPDVFDLLMSASDDLEAGFKDTFGEEDKSEDESKDKETEAQVQVTTDSNRTVEITEHSHSPVESLEASGVTLDSATKEDVTQDAFDLLMSAGDDLEGGFKDSFGSEEKVPKEPDQKLTCKLTETKLAFEPVENASPPKPENVPKSAEELAEETDGAPDVFDLLMSAGDDLEAGFKDAFGEEDQSEDKSKNKETEAQVQVTTYSNRTVEITEHSPSSVESQEASGVKLDSAEKKDVTQDAFDLLTSAGDDLEEGFKDAFGSEEKVPKDPDQQLTSKLTETKLAFEPVENASPPGPENVPKSAEELVKETGAAPDAFDLLMSAGDDLEAGFNDAFGGEDESEDKSEDKEGKEQIPASTDSTTDVGLTVPDANSSPMEPEKASQSEENVAKEAGSTLDAFDILMSAGDDLQEGFQESFSLEEETTGQAKAEVPGGTKPKDEVESTQKEIQAKIDEDGGVALSNDTTGTELAQTPTVQVGNVHQTGEEDTSEGHTSSYEDALTMPITTPKWFDKTLYDSAEAKYHEELSLNQGHGYKEASFVTETVTMEKIAQDSKLKYSETKAAEVVEIASELPSEQTVISDESVWYDKMTHDSAEARYHERLSRGNISGHCLQDSPPSTPATTSSSSSSVTTKPASFASVPKSETIEPPESETLAPESLPKSTMAPAESTWYDKAMHDEAEAHYYERLSHSQRAEPNVKDSQASSRATTKDDSAPTMLSSEQTWFDKPFHDSAETVHHVRQASNESDSSKKSFPLYEGCCDHFKPDDQQTPEDKTEPKGEVESYDSWTECKVYKVIDELTKSEESVQESTNVVPAEHTTTAATSSPKKETDIMAASSDQLDDLASQETPTATHISFDIGDPTTGNTGERSRSPTSEDGRSRRSTFNSAVSPLSPQVELDDVYFEDVVLAGRQSDVTMAALRGFTASPLSEGLAPGEQLDSLRTEPDLDLSEPGTADTLDDGPFSYEDIGDEGATTPVGDASASTAVQSVMSEVKPTSEPSEASKDDVLSSTSSDLVREVNLEVNIPAPELRRDVPSPSLDGGVTEVEMETSITAPAMPADLPPVSLGTDIPKPIMATEVGALDPRTRDILIPNIDIEIPSVQLITEDVPEPQTMEAAESEEPTPPAMTSTSVKSDVQSSAISQVSEVDPASNVTPTSPEVTISEVMSKDHSANGTKESSNISKELEAPSKQINEKLGLNEDGTVPLKETDEDVLKFIEQGAPRSPMATKRCSRKKKMRSGGRKSSSESIENQPVRDNRQASVQDQTSKPETETFATDVPTKEERNIPSSEAVVAAQPPSVASVTVEPKLIAGDDATATDNTLTEAVKEDISLALQPERQASPIESHAVPAGDTVSAQPKDAVSPVQTEPRSTGTEIADKPQTPATPVEPQPRPGDKKNAHKYEAPVAKESQPERAEKEIADQPGDLVGTTQLENAPCDKDTEHEVEAPTSLTEPEPVDTEILCQAKPEASAIPSESTSNSEDKPEVSVSPPEPQQKPADKSEVRVSPSEPQEPQLKPAEKPEVPVEAKPKLEQADKPVVPASSPKSQPKPADTRPSITTKSVIFTGAAEAKLAHQKPTTKAPASSRPILPDRTLFLPGDEGRTYASLMQQGADMLPARPVFTAHACHVCKRLHTKQHRLKSCGSCRLVAYCSAEHQRAHWPLHRALCKVITRRVRHLGTDHLYREALHVSSAEQWKKIRFKHMAVCEEMLGRPMEAYEKEMFLYPRACDTCHETNPEKLHTCANCQSVSFCSEEHLRKNHSKYCKDLRTLLDIHSYQNSHGVCDPPLPETVLDEYETLPPHIRELLVVSLLGPQRAMALGPVPLTVLSDYASYPLTLLYALQNIPTQPEAHISQLSELTVHVVGAEHATDCHPLSRWDAFLLHLLPRLRRLHVVFVGLELEAAGGRPGITQRDFTCAACRTAGRRLTCELQPSTAYHTYCRSPQFKPPHVIAAFNAGLHRFAGHERRDTWRETIPHLVRDGVPLILSGYTLLECPQDVARIQQEQKVDVLLPPMKNPYRSTRPQQNFLNEHEAPVVFKNQYVACLTAATKARK